MSYFSQIWDDSISICILELNFFIYIRILEVLNDFTLNLKLIILMFIFTLKYK